MKNKIMMIIIVVLASISCCLLIQNQVQAAYEKQYDKVIEDTSHRAKEVIDIVRNEEKLIDKNKITLPQVGEAYAEISVARVDFSKPLFYGDSDELLKKGIGHYTGSGLPGEGKPILLAGHNGTEFFQLRNMKKGDTVKIETGYGSYLYQIYDMEIKNASEFKVSQLQEPKEYLIMYCCYPFDSLNTQQRYFVYASYVSGPKFKEETK